MTRFLKTITRSREETEKFAEDFAKKILFKNQKSWMSKSCHGKILTSRAIIISLTGNLGAGKTTFTQGFAKGLGIKQKIISPTFVILKKFKITKNFQFPISNFQTKSKSQITNNKQKKKFLNLIHIDAYRLEGPEEILRLNWKELISNPQNIILIEWADKIKKILPKNSLKINFKFINENKREIIMHKFDFFI